MKEQLSSFKLLWRSFFYGGHAGPSSNELERVARGIFVDFF